MLRRTLILFLTLSFALAACTPGAGPQLIGSYPRSGGVIPSDVRIIYESRLTLEVGNVDSSADRAVGFARDHGGYLLEERTWTQDGRKHATLALAVPVPAFDGLRSDLLSLGTLVDETVIGAPKPIHSTDWNTYTSITLTLRPAPSAITWPSFPAFGWDPGRTLRQAFGVSFSIFAFVVDVLIWLVVVLGPFVLVGLGLRALWRRARRTTTDDRR
jgi:hypothetical protein